MILINLFTTLLAITAFCVSVEGVEVGNFINIIHNIGGTLTFNNANTLTITDFTWDGLGLDVYLYFYPPGVDALNSDNGGTILPVTGAIAGPNGALAERPFNAETIIATLPDGFDVCDIGTLTVWCRPVDFNFGHLPVSADDVFESQDPCTLQGGDVPVVDPTLNNCIPLHETLQLSWRVIDTISQVRFQLCGCQPSVSSANQYMGFGLSGSSTETLMFGADPTITWVDTVTGEANAVDYYLSAYTQCRAGVGACPDTLDSSGTCTNDVMDVTGFVRNGRQCVSFFKSFSTNDSTCDLTIDPSNENQYIVWGVGSLGETAFRHFTRAQRTDGPIHLGRTPADECMGVDLMCPSCPPFASKRIIAIQNSTFTVQIGPSGNDRGYLAITGQAGWGIAYYINGTLIPELVVERGKTYTFLVEGGDDPNILGNYHPFYITDSVNGGRLQNSQDVRDAETVYAGFDDSDMPTAVGPLCELQETQLATTSRQTCDDFQTYFPLLTALNPTQCNSPQAGRLVWTPDENTPDVVYYQCATHLNLGWRITVVDEGEIVTTEPTTPEPTTTEPTTSEPTTSEPTTTTVLPGDSATSLAGCLNLLLTMVVVTVALFK